MPLPTARKSTRSDPSIIIQLQHHRYETSAAPIRHQKSSTNNGRLTRKFIAKGRYNRFCLRNGRATAEEQQRIERQLADIKLLTDGNAVSRAVRREPNPVFSKYRADIMASSVHDTDRSALRTRIDDVIREVAASKT